MSGIFDTQPGTLLDRCDGGILVELEYVVDADDTGLNGLWLHVSAADEFRSVEIAPHQALDAFHHPMLYVDDPAPFSRPKVEAEA